MSSLIGTEATIGASSLRALFVGSGLPEKPYLLQTLNFDFGLPFPNLPSRYPFERYLELVEWLRLQLYPFDSEAIGYEKLGRNITKGFFQGMTGQVLKVTISVLGAQRSVRYFFRVAGGALPFGEFKVIDERPNYVRAILFNVPGSPDIMRGMALESMQNINVKNASVKAIKLTPDDTEFIATWDD